jgi:hypothetical protein
MPDIAMCLNNECPKRHLCYRKIATPNCPVQNCIEFKFGFDELGFFYCESYWPVVEEKP